MRVMLESRPLFCASMHKANKSPLQSRLLMGEFTPYS